MIRTHSPKTASARSQRGQYIIIVVVLLALGVGFLVFSYGSPRAVTAERNAQTEAAFAQVKQALIIYATYPPAKPGNTERPGELPCPDMNNDGFEDGSCAAGAVGRVPWKTLGMPEPKDGYGETLWYALAGPFRNKNMSSAPINSDTLGNLTVYQGSSATTLTSQAVAVLLSPGPTLAGQNRGCSLGTNCALPNPPNAASPSDYVCTGTPYSLVPLCNSSNFLEASGGGNNSAAGGPFIQAVASSTFNDRVFFITNADLMPTVEQRVAVDMMSLLSRYRAGSTGNVYPWADLGDGQSNGTPGSNAYNRGRFPCLSALPNNWGTGTIPTLPDWLTNGCATVSGWPAVIYYAVATNNLENHGTGCTTPGCAANSGLTLGNSGTAYACTYGASPFLCPLASFSSGTGNYLILITPGGWDGSAHSWSVTDWSPVTGYFEDPQNGDNSNDVYTIPSSTKANRDRMFIMQ